MILVAAKADLEMDRKVTKKQGEQLADRYNLNFVETSAKDGSNIEQIFQSLTQEVIKKFTE
jgi:GTPase SAR1 family protein